MLKLGRVLLSAVLLSGAFLPHADADTVIVEVRNNFFSPRDAVINEGDTVQWDWVQGSHTVTSGTGAAAAGAGSLFDVDSTSAVPTFSFTFDGAGLFDYFCRPHEISGMTGIVRVQAAGIPTLNEWALIVLSTLLVLAGLITMRRRHRQGQPAH